MLVIFNKVPCTDRNESMINEAMETWEADFQVYPSPYKWASLPAKVLPYKPRRYSMKGGRLLNAVPPVLPRPRRPSEAEPHLPRPPVSCLPFFITQQMTCLIGVPLLQVPAPAFSEHKAGNPFYLHSAAVPILCFFSKDRLPAWLSRLYPVGQAISSKLTILTFCCLWFF